MKTKIKTKFNFDIAVVKEELIRSMISYFTSGCSPYIFGDPDYPFMDENSGYFPEYKAQGFNLIKSMVEEMFVDIDTVNIILNCYFRNSIRNQHQQTFFNGRRKEVVNDIFTEDVMRKYKKHLIEIITLVNKITELEYEERKQKIIRNLEEIENESEPSINNQTHATE